MGNNNFGPSISDEISQPLHPKRQLASLGWHGRMCSWGLFRVSYFIHIWLAQQSRQCQAEASQYLCSRRNLLLQSFRRMDGTLEGEGIEEGKGEKKEHSDIQIPPCGSQFAGGTFFTCWQIYASQWITGEGWDMDVQFLGLNLFPL